MLSVRMSSFTFGDLIGFKVLDSVGLISNGESLPDLICSTASRPPVYEPLATGRSHFYK